MEGVLLLLDLEMSMKIIMFIDSNGTSSNQWVVYLIKFSESGKVEWQNIYFDTEGGDWAGEAITLTNENGAVVAVDNGSFGFLKINSF